MAKEKTKKEEAIASQVTAPTGSAEETAKTEPETTDSIVAKAAEANAGSCRRAG